METALPRGARRNRREKLVSEERKKWPDWKDVVIITMATLMILNASHEPEDTFESECQNRGGHVLRTGMEDLCYAGPKDDSIVMRWTH